LVWLQTISTVWIVTSHNKTTINRYVHTHNQLHNAASTIAHSCCLAFTTQGETHRGSDFEKRCCRWQFSLKVWTFFKKGQQKKFSAKKSQMPNPKIVWPIWQPWCTSGLSALGRYSLPSSLS